MMKKVRNKFLKFLGLPKTLMFNFRYFPLRDAIKLPVIVSHRVCLMDLSGEVRIPSGIRTGMIEIGFGEVGIFDQRKSRTIWQVSGKMEFKGCASIGHGSKISVAGRLVLGDNFSITAESSIVAQTEIIVGDNVLLSWDVLIIDTDFHRIFDSSGACINPNAPVVIGNRVWIGCRSLILKGTRIADGVIVAAASTVNNPVHPPNSIIGGSPAKILRENVTWKRH